MNEKALLPNQLGERLTHVVANRFIDEQKKGMENFDILVKYHFSTINKEFMYRNYNKFPKGHAIEHCKKLVSLIDVGHDEGHIFRRKVDSIFPKKNSTKEEAYVNTVIACNNAGMMSFDAYNIKGSRSEFIYKRSRINLVLRSHCLMRYMLRDNKIYNNLFPDIELSLMTFLPTVTSIINYHSSKKRMIVLPMSSGMAFGYVGTSGNEILNEIKENTCNCPDCVDFQLKADSVYFRDSVHRVAAKKLDMYYIEDPVPYSCVLSTYLHIETFTQAKERLYHKWMLLYEEYSHLFKKAFEDNFYVIKQDHEGYNPNNYEELSELIYNNIIKTPEWRYLEKYQFGEDIEN